MMTSLSLFRKVRSMDSVYNAIYIERENGKSRRVLWYIFNEGNHANIDLKFRFLSQLPNCQITPHRYQKDNKIQRSQLKP